MMKPARFALIAALLAATPALAQLSPLTDPLPRALDERSDKRLDRVEQTLREMRSILYQGRDTGKAVVVQPAETQGQVETLTRRVGDLEETLRRLNGQLDQLSADIAANRRDAAGTVSAVQAANSQNAQITGRLEALERRLADMTRQQAEAAAADPVQNFAKAMQLYTDAKYPAAANALQTFIDNFGNAAEAPEARYYLGESYFRQADYNNAATAYISAIRGWPQTAWAPDAVVKLSVSLIELKKTDDACGILAEFTTRYPRAAAAVKAQASSARSRAKCR